MPYQHCPACRLTVHLPPAAAAAGGSCPRCGAELRDEPRSLFARPDDEAAAALARSDHQAAAPTGRFARRPTPPRISAAAVRDALALRGGRRRSPA
jgi:hypothetical protein